ncbi:3'-5' exonuclease [Photobacterium sp. TY1-4]|uniref:3'-5' exonuclease n=1 Tax=Photobacterium sp. TY1-4 TaxID=2899122 RepID=UPI0021BE7737|nr:3'-5' exonuclease [Photobacterium sp. TY1-4]UXI03996.1 3'-5' exonuclease [Photobacterium sp. TY1-4]
MLNKKPATRLLTNHNTPDWPTFFAMLADQAKDRRLQNYYSAGMVSGDTPLKEVPFVALDFETTGLDPKKDEIISIGLVPFDMHRIRCRGSAQWVVNPNRPLEEESVVIHGITDSDVSSAPELLRVLEEVLSALAGKIVVVHFRQIEREFMNSALKARLNEGIQFPVVDTLAIESAVQHREFGGLWNKLKGKKPGSVRLGRARQRYGLPVYPPHQALTDALATAELLQAQIAYHFDPDTPIADLWL